MNSDLDYTFIEPEKPLSDFVDSFWMLSNSSGSNKEVVILPDGRIDLFFSRSAKDPFHITLMGIGTRPEQSVVTAGTLTFAISFKLPATEYILQDTVSDLLDKAKLLRPGFWDFSSEDLDDFDKFCHKASQKIYALLPDQIDGRKQKLFDLIYASHGEMPIQELSECSGWSSRQINRYFNQHYGISLKTYCSILRFRGSFKQIKDGNLFPEGNFTDQSHFIKEIKKLAGVLPKELSRNQNDRFIQLSTLPET